MVDLRHRRSSRQRKSRTGDEDDNEGVTVPYDSENSSEDEDEDTETGETVSPPDETSEVRRRSQRRCVDR